jgi:hypothetical protein
VGKLVKDDPDVIKIRRGRKKPIRSTAFLNPPAREYTRLLEQRRPPVQKAIPLGISKQRPETFLLKVPVVGEHFGQSFFAHRLHRNAIDETIDSYPFIVEQKQ